ncbi:MAG: DUF1501 domain-containing protein [Acidobacteria bacterium]|nr:DUF1501 domain-containing protein [Acidobacteriota bacterium]
MLDRPQFQAIQSRRGFLERTLAGLGSMALADLLHGEGRTAQQDDPLAPKDPHFAPKAKNVIFLFQAGAPSQMDLFDPKPKLKKYHGQSLPPELTKDLQLAFIKKNAQVMASVQKFRKCGQSGMEISDLLPHTQSIADEICLVRSMFSEAFNHHPGQSLLMTGSPLLGRPTVGAWLTYGLGSENRNLPGFVVLSSGRGTSGGSSNWSSGFLPSTYAGVPFRSSGDPILYLSNPDGVDRDMQRMSLDALKDLNQERLDKTGDLEIASRIQSYELAFRMQAAAPELLDFSSEPQSVLDSYGVGKEPMHPYAVNCLLARRMVERGVRFVMLAHASWDQHQNLKKDLQKNCDITDQPGAALIKDLKQRGLLDSTLVVWGGEFGRTSLADIRRPEDIDSAGRDHHPNGYSMWVAGGGVRGGQVIGSTDDLAMRVDTEKVHVHDLQATLLNQMGFDHTKLTYRHMGRDFRLTDVEGEIVRKMIA